jgi:hypothetical protein
MDQEKTGCYITLKTEYGFLCLDVADATPSEFIEWICLVSPFADLTELSKVDLTDTTVKIRIIELIAQASTVPIFAPSKQ